MKIALCTLMGNILGNVCIGDPIPYDNSPRGYSIRSGKWQEASGNTLMNFLKVFITIKQNSC
jgi:hypothetical protein